MHYVYYEGKTYHIDFSISDMKATLEIMEVQPIPLYSSVIVIRISKCCS